ncbi:hypothetical protein GGI05_005946, partial [Coemansia sp. RSA 2603]
PATAILVATDMVKKAVSPSPTGLRRLLNPSPLPSAPSAPSARINQHMPATTLRAIAVLHVLHCIVLSFPTQMSLALSKPANCAPLLRLALAAKVPLDVRRTLVTLAARWHGFLQHEAAQNLALVVDGFWLATGLPPDWAFLPKPPPNLRPALPPSQAAQNSLYMPAGSSPTSTASPAAAAAAAATSGAVPEIPLRKAEPPSTQPLPRAIEPSSDPQTLERMRQTAQELLATSTMIIDNLVALPLDDDPRSNPVITELMASMSACHKSCVADIARLEDTFTTRVLKQAIDEAKRCQWIYNDSVRAYEVWSAQCGVNGEVRGSSSGSGSGSGGWALDEAAQSRPLAERLPNGNFGGTSQDALQRASTRARGKMADTGASQ